MKSWRLALVFVGASIIGLAAQQAAPTLTREESLL
jgi:hypothetical protein